MIYVFVGLSIFLIVLFVLSACVVAGYCSRNEENEDINNEK